MAKHGRKRKASAADTDALLERIVDEALDTEQGKAPQQLADDDLFVIDTEPDNAAIHIPHSGRKRPRASKEKKLTRAQAIIAGAKKAAPFGVGGAYAPRKRPPASTDKLTSTSAGTQVLQRAVQRAEDKQLNADVWEEEPESETWLPEPIAVSRPTSLGKPNRPEIEAVEVDPAGCSYNPDYEHHQDAVAEAVAAEMSKQIERELEPAPIPLTVTQGEFELSEMAVGLGSDDEDAEHESDEDGDKGAAALNQKKKTKRDRARQERQREQEAALAKKKSLKAMRRDIDAAKALNQALNESEEEVALRQARRKADKEDKERSEPPKLGRHKWQPAKLQVLASDDISGSLRKLRAFPMVAKDRFNSLQKRGVVQVTVQQHWTKPTKRRVKQFEKGLVREQAIKGQEEVDALSRSNREREKKRKMKK